MRSSPQNQCAASGRGIPLREREDCAELIEKNTNIANPNARATKLAENGEFTCYIDNKNILYYANQNSATNLQNGGSIVRLQQVEISV